MRRIAADHGNGLKKARGSEGTQETRYKKGGFSVDWCVCHIEDDGSPLRVKETPYACGNIG